MVVRSNVPVPGGEPCPRRHGGVAEAVRGTLFPRGWERVSPAEIAVEGRGLSRDVDIAPLPLFRNE